MTARKSGRARSFDVQCVTFLASLTLIGLHAFIVYVLPEIASENYAFLKRSWGFHFWIFYPTYIALSLYAIAIVAAVPSMNQRAAKWGEKAVTAIAKKIRPAGIYSVLCLLAWAIFYLGRQKYGFLGDGYVRASDVAAGRIASEGAGTMYLLLALQGWIGHYDASGVLAMQLFSVFCGGPYVVLVCLWANRICNRQNEKVLCAGLMIFLGAIQYFFSYIETYAPLPVFILSFLLAGIIALRDDKPPIWATVFFIVGAFMHILLVFLVPAFLWLWYDYFARRFSIFRDRKTVGLGAVISVVVAYVFSESYAHVLLPLYPSPTSGYAILTYWHVWEWSNAQVLSAPMGWPVLFLWFFAGHRAFSRELIFCGVSAFGALAGLFVIDPALGSRDWDLLCLSGVPLMAFATYVLYNGGLTQSLRGYASRFGCVCAALLIIPWVHINHTDRSVARVIKILDGDPGSYYLSHSVEMTLASFFWQAGLDSLAMSFADKAYQKYPQDPRMPYNIGAQLVNRDVDKAIPYFLRALEISPNYPAALTVLVQCFAVDPGQTKKAMETHFGLQHADPNVAARKPIDMWHQLGHFIIRAQKDERSRLTYAQALNNIGIALAKKSTFENTGLFFEKAHQLAPEIEFITLNLTKFYITQQDTNRAVQILNQALIRAPENLTFRDMLKKLK